MHKDLITLDPQTSGVVDPYDISVLTSATGQAEGNWHLPDQNFPMQEEEFERQNFIDLEVAEEAAVFRPDVRRAWYAPAEKQRYLHHLNPNAYEPVNFLPEAESTTLLDPVLYVDPRKAVVSELSRKVLTVECTRRDYKVRIEELRQLTEAEDYCLNPSSERDFWSFFELNPFVRQGNLVLLENGNLRAIWKDGRGTQIGLQFLGERTIQFVIFKVRTKGRQVSRAYGRDGFEGIKCQIQTFELHQMMSS